MRIATFNILGGRSPGDDHVNVSRFADAVATLDADLLALQEVDRDQSRSQRVDLTAVAADAMGAVAHRFAPALTGTPGESWAAATDDDPPHGPAYGVAFLSRFPVTGWRVVRLPAAPARVPYRWPGRMLPSWVRDEPRVALVADVAPPLGPMRVVTTHLSFLPGWNLRQLRLLLHSLGPGSVILAGDLNVGRAVAQRVTGMRALVVGPTFPAHTPTRQIDHLLTNADLRATGGPRQLGMSDHPAYPSPAASGGPGVSRPGCRRPVRSGGSRPSRSRRRRHCGTQPS